MSEDKELVKKIKELEMFYSARAYEDATPHNYFPDRLNKSVEQLVDFIHADRQRWLKELLPEKKKIIHTEVYNGIIVNSNPFYIRERINGFNECLSLIKEKAGIKE